MQSIAETDPKIARDTVYILQRISQDFLVIYSCTVRGIVYLNIDKAYSLSFSLSWWAKSRGAKLTEKRDIIRPEVHVRS